MKKMKEREILKEMKTKIIKEADKTIVKVSINDEARGDERSVANKREVRKK